MDILEKSELRNKLATANNRLSDEKFGDLLWEFRSAESELASISLARLRIRNWIENNYKIL